MAWTYEVTELSDSELFQVRLHIGDINTDDQQLQDEEINLFLDTEANVYRAAAAACRALVARYARKVDKDVGDLKIKHSQRLKHYQTLAETLFSKGGSLAVPTAGGVYVADREANEGNESIIQPAISVGMHDFE